MRLSDEQMAENVRIMADRESLGLNLWTGKPENFDGELIDGDEMDSELNEETNVLLHQLQNQKSVDYRF